ncbi:MAG TPA: hypothetical protein VFU75_05980 [Gemmatimonadales bacterium]|nr:hypothetical protein [Gemmatimonadales bacterium]
MILAACSDSTGPNNAGGGQSIKVGQTVSVNLTPADSFQDFLFRGSTDSVYVVEVGPTTGSAYVSVLDSIHLFLNSFTTAGTSTDSAHLWTQTFAGPASDPWVIRLRSAAPGQTTALTIKVLQVATGPEHISSTITPDSVTNGESLDGYDDFDRFTFPGTAGQLVELFVQGTATGAPTQAVCFVLDTFDTHFLALSVSGAQDSVLEAPINGRVSLPTTRTYRVEASSSRNGCRDGFGPDFGYLGPYRMLVYRIDTLPEQVSDTVAVGDTVKGEAVDRVGDIDVFALHGTAGQLVDLQFASPSSGSKRQLQVFVSGAATSPSTFSTGGDTSLDEHATGRFVLPGTGQVTLRVDGVRDGRGGDAGPYVLYAYPVNPNPEHLPIAITLGDTVTGEAIDHVGDLDQFTFTATAGQLFNGFLQASGAAPSAQITLQVLGPDSTAASGVANSTGADVTLLDQVTGRFQAPATGTYTVRVSGANQDAGPYRFAILPVSRAPETASSSLAFGDSVSNEAIDFPGDLDEFHTVITDSSGANIVLTPDSGAIHLPLQAFLYDSVTGVNIAAVTAFDAGFPAQTGTMVVPPCHCILRVVGGYDSTSTFRGGYTLKFYKFGFGSETVGDTVAIGDTIVGEAINPPGDRDDFVFHATKGQHVNVALEGESVASPGQFQLIFQSVVYSPTAPDSLNAHRTNRIDIPSTGWYAVSVSGSAFTNPLTAPGAYKLALEPVPVGPEHAAATLAVGDSVTNESIDYPGDWDEFTLTGTPGTKVAVSFTIQGAGGNPHLEVFDSTADSVVALAVGQPGVQVAGPATFPASGQLVIRVFEVRGPFGNCTDTYCNGIFGYTGGYKITTAVAP